MELLWTIYNFLAFISFASIVLVYLFKLLKIVYVYFIARIVFARRDFRQKYGDWAVVTGGSDGIGKNYARELAKRKINLVLISNVEEDLISVSKEIEETFKVNTRIIVADFSLGEDEYQRIFTKIKDLNISILINNVGISAGLPNRLQRMSRKQIWNMMMINACAAVSMAHYLLPQMKSSGKGLIVNMASAAAIMPMPFANIYGASKVFTQSFSEALRIECDGTGIEVQTLCPCFVDTKICQNVNAGRKVSLMYPSPEKFAESAVATVGITGFATGYWPHELQYMAMGIGPQWLVIKVATFVMSFYNPKKKQR